MALTVQQIVSGLRISRSEFGRIFLAAQMDVVVSGADRQPFDAVTHAGNDQQAFTEALNWAEQKQFLDAMVRGIVNDHLEDGSITAELAEEAMANGSTDPAHKAALQAMMDLSRGFDRPEIQRYGMNLGMRWTVKVLVDGAFKGTGILIGPNLVLTAWHVVSSLFEPALEPTQRDRFLPNSKAQSRITVIFDDLTGILDGRLEKARPTSYDAHVDWCAAHSECHPAELKQTLPPDLKELNGFWDYAVLRLAKTPGLERLWAALDDRAVVPPAKERMVLFQHPAGQPMRCDSSVLVKPDGTYADAIPHLRFLHQANAVGGSSGGPCFDRQFMFFGLHQGVWQKPEDGVEGANRGVPITQIKQHIAQKIPNFPVPDPAETPVWKRLTTDPDFPGGPIIGCDAFQSLLWKSAIKGSPKFIVINGPEGSGKSFRLTVLSAMLPDSGHLKLCLRAEAISKFTALDLAKEVCKTAGAQVPNFVQAEDFHSSVNAWVRDELVQKVVQALDVARSGRLVWITIADLNRSAIQGDLASDFLLSLYDQVRTVEWLRIVLDDMKGDVLSTIRNVMEYHRVEYVTRDDTETYLNRAFAEFGVMPEGLPNFARYAFWEYQESLNKGAVLPMAGLSNQLFNFVEVLFRK